MIRVVLIASSLALVACQRPSAAGPPEETPPPTRGSAMPAQPADAFARVVSHAGPDADVIRVEDKIEGVELFRVVRRPAGATAPGRGTGAAVVAGDDAVLTGKDAYRAALDRVGRDDPDRLARLALALLEPRAGDPQPGATLTGDTLTYAWRTGDGPGRAIVQSKLDLGTLDVAAAPASGRGDPVAVAVRGLADPSDMTRNEAVDALAAQCAEPRAIEALTTAMKSHPEAGTRARAAEAAGRCDAIPIAALAEVLKAADDPSVRVGAATGLGIRGGAEAEAALRDAIGGQSDAAVKQAIGRAVKRIMASNK